MKTRTLVIGDIHNNYKALIQCLQRSNFNYEHDQLICLGDIFDGYPDAYECAEELLKIKNLILLNGNHDEWVYDYFTKGSLIHIHLSQGGQSTVNSYQKHGIPETHIKLLESAIPYYIDNNNKLFVHGGINLNYPLNEQKIYDLVWDRSMVDYAYNCENTQSCDIPKKLQQYNEIFVGHTTTEHYGTIEPLKLCNVYMMDTGAGWNSKLSIMDVDTHEYWQSDLAIELYGPNQGRSSNNTPIEWTKEELELLEHFII